MQCFTLFTASTSLAVRGHSTGSVAREATVLVDQTEATTALDLQAEVWVEEPVGLEVEGRLDSDKSPQAKNLNTAWL